MRALLAQRADQLHRELSAQAVLAGFVEGKQDFPPTFKVRPAPRFGGLRGKRHAFTIHPVAKAFVR